MRFLQRPIHLDLTPVKQSAAEGLPLPLAGLVYPASVRAHVQYDQFRFDLKKHWNALGELRWRLLERTRMEKLLPVTDDVSEFELYYQTIKHSSPQRQAELLIGLDHHLGRPLWIPRSVLNRHGYITGPTGVGKTARALATLLVQLSDSYTNVAGTTVPRPAVVILDFQPKGGDPFLRGLARWIAAQRGQELLEYSTDPRFESLSFAPWNALNRTHYPKAFAETMMKAFSLMHRESQDSVFFGNEQRYELERELCDPHSPPRSMRELIKRLENRTRGKKGNREARGVHGALSVLEHAVNVELDAVHPDAPGLLNFDTIMDERRVLYVQLDSDTVGPLSATLGKLMLTSLLQASADRQYGSDDRTCVVVIDEFQRLAAHNVVSMLEVARKMGVSMLLSQQTPASLSSENASVFDLIFDTVGFVQVIAPRGEDLQNAMVRVSGRKLEVLHGGSTGYSESTQQSSNWNSGTSHTRGSTSQTGRSMQGSWETSGSSSGSQSSFGSGGGKSEGESHSTEASWREEYAPGVTPDMFVTASEEGNCLVFAPGPKASLTPEFQTPRIVQQLFPFTAEVAERMRKAPRSLVKPRALPPGTQVSPQAGIPTIIATPSRSSETRNAVAADLVAAMQQSVESLAAKLLPSTQREWVTVRQFGRRHGLKSAQVLQLCAEAGQPLSGPEARVPSELASKLSAIIASVLKPGGDKPVDTLDDASGR
jgi:Cdc6-like AAA superfamily ATPase